MAATVFPFPWGGGCRQGADHGVMPPPGTQNATPFGPNPWGRYPHAIPGGRNGIDVSRELAALTSAPISGILISGDTWPATIQAANAAGYPLLHKPVSPANLRAVVTHFAWTMRKGTDAASPDEDTAR